MYDTMTTPCNKQVAVENAPARTMVDMIHGTNCVADDCLAILLSVKQTLVGACPTEPDIPHMNPECARDEMQLTFDTLVRLRDELNQMREYIVG